MPKTLITRTPDEESDHNLLISLNGKVDNLTEVIEKMNDGIRNRLRDAEVRIRELEIIVEKVDPLVTYQRFLKVEQTQNYMKFALYFLGVLGIIIAWTTGLANDIINIFKK